MAGRSRPGCWRQLPSSPHVISGEISRRPKKSATKTILQYPPPLGLQNRSGGTINFRKVGLRCVETFGRCLLWLKSKRPSTSSRAATKMPSIPCRGSLKPAWRRTSQGYLIGMRLRRTPAAKCERHASKSATKSAWLRSLFAVDGSPFDHGVGQAVCSMASGRRTRMRVPFPGLTTSSEPPSSRARDSIPFSPNPLVATCG